MHLSYRGVRIGLFVVFPLAIASMGVSAQTMTPQQRLQHSADDIDAFLRENGQGTPVVAGAATGLSGAPTFNELFQTRNPRVCAKVMTVPDAAQAAALVQCDREAASVLTGFNPVIFLTTDVQVEIGKPRNFMQSMDSWQDIDVSAKVYPLRGSATGWTCGYARDSMPFPNCNREAAAANSTGECWQTNFQDWRCHMAVGGGTREMRVKGPTDY